jgi:hypothetical protein
MHYGIILLVVVVIVVLQIVLFVNTLLKIGRFKTIFPESVIFFNRKEDALKQIQDLSDDDLKKRLHQENQKIENFYKKILTPYSDLYIPRSGEFQLIFDRNKAITFLKGKIKGEISSSHDNTILTTIISAINDYLTSNKDAVSDFHLMKDIVDRNCDSKEEDFQTQIPIPLYFGLGGTMLGILIGVGLFVFDGGMDSLLYPDTQNLSNISGIETLLGGVAIAMISSFMGIVLTTIGSYVAKFAKSTVENNKHIFLTWIQAKLLPSLASDTSSALVKMSQNLRAFNDTFSKNTGDLGKTLAQVNESYGMQKLLWDSIKEIADKDLQQVNLELFTTLKESIREIAKLGDYLQGINKYQLNTNDAIEKMQKFFGLGIEQIDGINIGVKNALERFAENSNSYLSNLQEKLDSQIINVNNVTQRQQEELRNYSEDIFRTLTTALKLQNDELLNHFETVSTQMQSATKEQQEIFRQKLKETTALVEELKNLTHIKEGIKDFKEAIKEQNEKIKDLAKEISALAKAKIEGGTIRQEINFPKWLKIIIITGSSLITVTCLFYIVPLLIELINKLINWLF